jgi:Aluminium induced protein
MLGVFSGEVVEVPEELVAAGSRTPSPKTRGSELVNRFLAAASPAVSIQLGSFGQIAYSHANQSPFRPRLISEQNYSFF